MGNFQFLEMFKSQVGKMFENNNAFFGSLMGAAIAIPSWIYEKELRLQHVVLMVLLIGVLVVDHIVGSRLAKKSDDKLRTSYTLFDSIVRDFIIIAVCAGAYGLDYLLGTYTIIYSIVTFAFILQNSYSVAGNIYVMGWTKYYPVWLFKWAKDEIEAKKDKYFPDDKE